MLICTMTQTKGGSGKSTLAQCVAVEAVRDGRSVLLADLDPAQSAAKWWRRRGGPTNPMLETGIRGGMAALTDSLERKGKPDVLVLDTPGELMGVIRVAIATSNVIVVPMAPSIKDWEAMDSVESIITKAGKLRNTIWVINRFRTGTEASTEARRALHKRTGAIPLTVALATDHERADAEGRSGAEINRKIAGEIGLLWQEIKRIGEADEQKTNVPAA